MEESYLSYMVLASPPLLHLVIRFLLFKVENCVRMSYVGIFSRMLFGHIPRHTSNQNVIQLHVSNNDILNYNLEIKCYVHTLD